MPQIKILAFSGSTRRDSYNRKLLTAVTQLARAQNADVTVIDLNDYPLPIYNGDIEDAEGMPPAAHALQTLFSEHDAVFISTPEYNGFFPALLKNTLDWISRPTDTQGASASFSGIPVALFAASPGRLGGIRALGHLRSQMADLGAIVQGTGVSVGEAHTVFGEKDGEILSEPISTRITAYVTSVLRTVS